MSVVIKDLLTHFPTDQFVGNNQVVLNEVVSFLEAVNQFRQNSISWVNDKNASEAIPKQLHLGLLILSPDSYEKLKSANCNFLIAQNPRAVFTTILSVYFKNTREAKIERTAFIHESATIGANCYIGHHVIIEANCRIGDNCIILHNSVLLENTVIGNHVIIGCNNTIGNYGFGYEKDQEGNFQLIEHLGKVVIHDNVEIHNNTCIDRGVLGITEIHENVKIDNHVHIAHGVVIGKNSLIIAHAMIGGSVKIGEDVWIAPATAIKNQIKIADQTLTGIGAVVLKDTSAKNVVIGNPATTMEEYKKWSDYRKKIMKDDSQNSQ